MIFVSVGNSLAYPDSRANRRLNLRLLLTLVALELPVLWQICAEVHLEHRGEQLSLAIFGLFGAVI